MTTSTRSPSSCSDGVVVQACHLERSFGGCSCMGAVNPFADHDDSAGRCQARIAALAEAGLHSFAQHVAMELAGNGIRVNGVSPAVVLTPICGAFIEPSVDAAGAGHSRQSRASQAPVNGTSQGSFAHCATRTLNLTMPRGTATHPDRRGGWLAGCPRWDRRS